MNPRDLAHITCKLMKNPLVSIGDTLLWTNKKFLADSKGKRYWGLGSKKDDSQK